jgi:Transposase DNA-binding
MRKSKASDLKKGGSAGGKAWVESEIAGSEFKDERLKRRFGRLLEQMASGPGESIPLVCEDWANTKAAYRFLSNEQVSEAEILAGHFQSTRERFAASEGPALVLHDTCEFTYKREDIEAVGMTRIGVAGARPDGRPRHYTACGILMHSSLVVTADGLPLGLSAIKFWTREKFKGANELKRHVNPTRVPIEQKESIRWLENLRQSAELLEDPTRCVHIGDRESDIYELFCTAQELGTRFLVRTCVDRLAGDGDHTIADEMAEVDCKGLHRVQVQDKKGNISEAVLELRYRRIRVLPPIGKQKQYPQLVLTVLHARERDKPRGRERVDWKLLTNLSVTSRADAIEKLQWYAMRWKIETFHKILKSGCKAEESKLRTAERLVNLIAIFCIVSWRIFWLTMVNRTQPDASPRLAFTKLEIQLLDRLTRKTPPHSAAVASVSCYLTRLARLGGYLDRAHDPPPGNKVIWKGMARLTDVQIGYLLAKDMGN